MLIQYKRFIKESAIKKEKNYLIELSCRFKNAYSLSTLASRSEMLNMTSESSDIQDFEAIHEFALWILSWKLNLPLNLADSKWILSFLWERNFFPEDERLKQYWFPNTQYEIDHWLVLQMISPPAWTLKVGGEVCRHRIYCVLESFLTSASSSPVSWLILSMSIPDFLTY